MKPEFSRQILENTEISNFMKIRPVGADLFQAEERMDRQPAMMKLIVTFRIEMNEKHQPVSHSNRCMMHGKTALKKKKIHFS